MGMGTSAEFTFLRTGAVSSNMLGGALGKSPVACVFSGASNPL